MDTTVDEIGTSNTAAKDSEVQDNTRSDGDGDALKKAGESEEVPVPVAEKEEEVKEDSKPAAAAPPPPAAETNDKKKSKRTTRASSPKKKTTKSKPKGKGKRKRPAKEETEEENTEEDTNNTPKKPKVDGRSKNKGAAKRESYSVAYKAKMVRDFEDWEAEQKNKGVHNPSVREFVLEKNLGHKFENFLSKANGWRSPKVRARILQAAAVTDYQHMARVPDRTKNRSYYADMEEALVQRLEECRAKNLTVTTKLIRELARQELRRLTNNDEEKVNAFKASNGWVYNFLKRQERKAKDQATQLKRDKANEKKRKDEATTTNTAPGAATINTTTEEKQPHPEKAIDAPGQKSMKDFDEETANMDETNETKIIDDQDGPQDLEGVNVVQM